MLARGLIHSVLGALIASLFSWVGYYQWIGGGDFIAGWTKLYAASSIPFRGDITFPTVDGLFTTSRFDWVIVGIIASLYVGFALRSSTRPFTLRNCAMDIVAGSVGAAVTLVGLQIYVSYVLGDVFGM